MPVSVPFALGLYAADEAWLTTPGGLALPLAEVVIEVSEAPAGGLALQGRGYVRNDLMVHLLEEEATLHILLDMGGEFKYFLDSPAVSAGKMLVPGVSSILRFSPRKDLEPLSEADYARRRAALRVVAD